MRKTPPSSVEDRATRLKRLRFRASHRGTQEADLIIGGFADRYADGFSGQEFDWFEALLEEQDQDILNWVTGKDEVPARLDCPLMQDLRKLDYLERAK